MPKFAHREKRERKGIANSPEVSGKDLMKLSNAVRPPQLLLYPFNLKGCYFLLSSLHPHYLGHIILQVGKLAV